MKKTALRAIRKTSHIAKQVGQKGVNFLGKVENKATFLINNGILGDSVKIDDIFYSKYISSTKSGFSTSTSLFRSHKTFPVA